MPLTVTVDEMNRQRQRRETVSMPVWVGSHPVLPDGLGCRVGRRAVVEPERHRHRTVSARRAACTPHMKCTPPPGAAEEEHRYTPGTPVSYG